MTDLALMETTLAAIERDHGLIRVLFNNAGIYHPEKDFLDVPLDQFDGTMAVNVRVPFFASQWVAKRLIAAGQPGAIVKNGIISRTTRSPARPARHQGQRDRARPDQYGDGGTHAADREGSREGERSWSARRTR